MTTLKTMLALVLCWGLAGSWCCCQASEVVEPDAAPEPAGCCAPPPAEPAAPSEDAGSPAGDCGCGQCDCVMRGMADLPPLAQGAWQGGVRDLPDAAGHATDLSPPGPCQPVVHGPDGGLRPAAREMLRRLQVWQV